MFLTGEFSRIAQVSKRLLRYYDRIGLFQPAHVDPQTGYRYYSARQLPQLNRILALKELGLSLDQIGRMVADEVGDEEIRGMLLLKKAELEQTLMQDVQRLRSIEARLLHGQSGRGGVDVVTKAVPALAFLSTRLTVADAGQGMALLDRVLQTVPAKVGRHNLGAFTVLIHSDGYEAENADVEMGFALTVAADLSLALADGVVFSTRELPAVETMATVVVTGDPAARLDGFHALGHWVEDNGYRLAGLQREVVLEGFERGAQGEIVLEIQFPVRAARQGRLLPLARP
jgi:DNA-binding transcriptional MerR regulator